MRARLFLSQAAVEGWSAEGRADLAGDALVAQGGALHGARFALEPALRVRSVAGGGADPHGLVGRVRRATDLRALGAEVVGDSLLLGEVAYEAEPGYLALPDEAAAALLLPAPAPSVQAVAAPPPSEVLDSTPPEGQTDAAALARFLLNHLS